jgi:hypothetical protein
LIFNSIVVGVGEECGNRGRSKVSIPLRRNLLRTPFASPCGGELSRTEKRLRFSTFLLELRLKFRSRRNNPLRSLLPLSENFF